MMTLARVVADRPHAVQRDLLCHGFQWGGLGLPEDRLLPFRRFVSFVLGAPPESALGQAVAEGWTKTDELLANIAEQHAGLISLVARIPRPGVEPPPEPEDTADVDEKPPAEAAEVNLAMQRGGRFDRFGGPAVFEARLAGFKARLNAMEKGEDPDAAEQAVLDAAVAAAKAKKAKKS
jgi:hypothetical protein